MGRFETIPMDSIDATASWVCLAEMPNTRHPISDLKLARLKKTKKQIKIIKSVRIRDKNVNFVVRACQDKF